MPKASSKSHGSSHRRHARGRAGLPHVGNPASTAPQRRGRGGRLIPPPPTPSQVVFTEEHQAHLTRLRDALAAAKGRKDPPSTISHLQERVWVLLDLRQGVRTNMPTGEYEDLLSSLLQPPPPAPSTQATPRDDDTSSDQGAAATPSVYGEGQEVPRDGTPASTPSVYEEGQEVPRDGTPASTPSVHEGQEVPRDGTPVPTPVVHEEGQEVPPDVPPDGTPAQEPMESATEEQDDPSPLEYLGTDGSEDGSEEEIFRIEPVRDEEVNRMLEGLSPPRAVTVTSTLRSTLTPVTPDLAVLTTEMGTIRSTLTPVTPDLAVLTTEMGTMSVAAPASPMSRAVTVTQAVTSMQTVVPIYSQGNGRTPPSGPPPGFEDYTTEGVPRDGTPSRVRSQQSTGQREQTASHTTEGVPCGGTPPRVGSSHTTKGVPRGGTPPRVG